MNKRKKFTIVFSFLILSFLITKIYASSIPDNIMLIRIQVKTMSSSGFDLEFTVNDIAVQKNASVVFGYTTNGNLSINKNNISDMYALQSTQTVPLSDLRLVKNTAYQSVYSTYINASLPQNYYVYAMLKTNSATTDIKNCAVAVTKENFQYFIPFETPRPSPSPTPTPEPTATPTPEPTATPTPESTNIPVPTATPTQTPIPTITKIVAGIDNAAMISSDGRAWIWGANNNGKLGNGSNANVLSPTELIIQDSTSNQLKILDISMGLDHTMALTQDGRIFTWGDNSHSQLGYGPVASNMTPREVPIAYGTSQLFASAISAGKHHNLILTTDGLLWGWGNGTFGEFGDSSMTTYNSPHVITITDSSNKLLTAKKPVAAIDASLVLTTDGRLWGSGLNDFSLLGNSGNKLSKFAEIAINSGSTKLTVDTIFNAGCSTIAKTADGKFWTWGAGNFGQLGIGGNEDKPPAQQLIINNLTIKDVQVGSKHAAAITTDGRAWIWGNNSAGQLGNGTNTNINSPVELVMNNLSIEEIYLNGASDSSYAKTTDGRFWAWGLNSSGQLGNGTIDNTNVPVEIPNPLTSL